MSRIGVAIGLALVLLVQSRAVAQQGATGKTGVVWVTSIPATCQIEFRGQTVEKRRPKHGFRDVPVGDHPIAAVHDGKKLSASVTVCDGLATEVLFRFEPGVAETRWYKCALVVVNVQSLNPKKPCPLAVDDVVCKVGVQTIVYGSEIRGRRPRTVKPGSGMRAREFVVMRGGKLLTAKPQPGLHVWTMTTKVVRVDQQGAPLRAQKASLPLDRHWEFGDCDTDGDGKVSRDESPGLLLNFYQHDLNGDGFITSVEKTTVKQQEQQRRLDGLLRHYDKDGDGKLSPNEIKQDRWFKLVDKNRDGFITRDDM